MGGSGANSFSRDLSVLNERDRSIYEFVLQEQAAGRYCTDVIIGKFIGRSHHTARNLRLRITRKVGWPFSVSRCPIPVSALTERESSVYEFVVRETSEGRICSDVDIGKFIGRSRSIGRRLRMRITRKVGWPFLLSRRVGGTHGLTPEQRQVLLMAIELHEGGEYPSVSTLVRVLGKRSNSGYGAIMNARRVCTKLKIWPCPIKKRPPYLDSEQRDYIVSLRKDGKVLQEIPVLFRERFGRKVGLRTVNRVLHNAGCTYPYRSREPLLAGLEARQREVIAERNGLCPRKLEDPAAFRRSQGLYRRSSQ